VIKITVSHIITIQFT